MPRRRGAAGDVRVIAAASGSDGATPAASARRRHSRARDHASPPIAHRLYLPRASADDSMRRTLASVPPDVVFETKPRIGPHELQAALGAGIAAVTVLTDAGYGVDTDFRDRATALDVAYVAGIQFSTSLWPSGTEPLAPKRWSGRGHPTSLMRRNAEQQPISAK